MKLKQYLTRPICLILSLVVLLSAMTVAAFTGSPYDILKKAALDTAFAESGSYTADVALYVNGQPEFSENSALRFAPTAKISVSNGELSLYQSDALVLIPTFYYGDSGEEWYRVYLDQYADGNSFRLLPEDIERDGTYVRFAELAVDALVGDLKNNISISDSDGVKKLSATLTAGQIPELYNAGLSLLVLESTGSSSYHETTLSESDGKSVIEEVRLDGKTKTTRVYEITYTTEITEDLFKENYGYFDQEEMEKMKDEYFYQETGRKLISEKIIEATAQDYGEPLDQPLEAAAFDYVSATAHVDENGYLTDMTGTVRIMLTTLFGETHELEAVVNLDFEDIGECVVESPIPGVDELFTEDFFAERHPDWNIYYQYYYFLLKDDGTPDPDSIIGEDLWGLDAKMDPEMDKDTEIIDTMVYGLA